MNYRKSVEFERIGVASSVSFKDGRFDQLQVLHYARRHRFSPVQLYLDDQTVTDRDMRQRLLASVRKQGIPIMLHAPGVLKLPNATEPSIIESALELLAGENARRVVYHFDETQPVTRSLAITEMLCARGIIPCIENFHQLRGADNGRRNYAKYLDLLTHICDRSLPALPVIDVPRTFHEALEFTDDEACELSIAVLKRIGSMGFPVLFHLIDAKARRQARGDWCAVGDGIIPYARIFRETAELIKCDDVIFEFEDLENPLRSREFLRSLANS